MAEWRKDSIVDRWVIIAETRAQRPGAFDWPQFALSSGGACPFCEGREQDTPDEVYAVRDRMSLADSPGWRLRVVPNKYPALAPDEPRALSIEPLHVSRSATGRHEVIIESPRHVSGVSEWSAQEAEEAFWAYRQRLHQLKVHGSYRHALVFKNVGRAAGASIEHTHSQLVATDFVPTSVAEELRAAEAHFVHQRRCIFCDLIETERGAGERVIHATDEFVALSAYGSRFPYETWIVPRRHESHFEEASRATTDRLAAMMVRTVSAIETTVSQIAYNFIIHSAPFDTLPGGHYHWHVEVLPRLTTAAGFEWGSGCFVNPVAPERAAAELRAAWNSGD
jgi:UDPglucose--hexose-1-phosphate uridylyltransferase